MAESTLTLSFTDLKAEVGYFLGYSRTSTNWNSGQVTEIESIVQAGVRRVYYPVGSGENSGYEWSFLRPSTTLSITTGDFDYDLPDAFGRMIGNFHYDTQKLYPEIKIISVESILEFRSRLNETNPPWFAAIRPKSSTGSTGQRSEVIFYPTPDAAYTLRYAYEAYSGALTASLPYPLGGMHLSELYVESCLAVAEQRMNGEVGIHTQIYQALLIDAIARDRKRGAVTYGRMGNKEPTAEEFHHGDTSSPYPITYKSQSI